ncbi:hypothetical protein AC96_3556 [Escherichia coli 2-156-04_S4_C2]|uniref:Uncharacterized protein n=1 Tax=Escherichia coli 97.0246 TaxID=869670 RepID=A0A8E0KVD3_ECOLX|nr:hypothetical protein EC970246_3076 [Escherichia coli 97.0246]KDX23897.1 hypothetical protein AC96_3556 [Escherichia coli 2-156-04_S4_C2]
MVVAAISCGIVDLYRYVIFLIWQNRMIVETGSKTRVG